MLVGCCDKFCSWIFGALGKKIYFLCLLAQFVVFCSLVDKFSFVVHVSLFGGRIVSSGHCFVLIFSWGWLLLFVLVNCVFFSRFFG